MKYIYKAILILNVINLLCSFQHAYSQINIAWIAPYSSSFNLFDYGREIKTDALGNVYVGGHTLINAQQEGLVTIVKYDNNGNFLWEYHTPAINYTIEDMEVDLAGNVFYTGAHWVSATNDYDYHTAKVNASGSEIWTADYDGNGIGNGWDYGWAIALDDSDNVYVTGHSQGTFNGYDLVTVKYDSSGQQQWVARYVNPDNIGLTSNYFNTAFEILPDHSGSVYISGYFFNGTTHELSVVKYDASGNFLWAADFDTQEQWTQVQKNYMKLDANDNIYLLGNIQNAITGCDVLLLKYDSAGTFKWSRTWNSPGNDSDYVCGVFYTDEALAIDNNGNIFVSATTSDPSVLFHENIVTLKYDSLGTLLWTDIFNAAANDEDRAISIALDNNGNAYVCGSSYHSSGIIAQDYITFKLNGSTGAHQWDTTYNSPVDAMDAAHAIYADALQNVYVTGFSMTNTDPFNPTGQIVTIKYSPTNVGINENNIADDIQFSITPSPVSDGAFVSYFLNENVQVSFCLYNCLGEKVFDIPQKNQLKGNHSKTLDLKNIRQGVYFLKLVAGNKIYTEKIIKVTGQ